MWQQIYWPTRGQRREVRETTTETHAVEALPPKR
jgi:hypothetical protein